MINKTQTITPTALPQFSRDMLPVLAGLLLFYNSLIWIYHRADVTLFIVAAAAYAVFLGRHYQGFKAQASAIALIITLSLLQLLNRYSLDIQLLSAAFFILFCLTLGACYIKPEHSKKLQLPLLLALLILPLNDYLQAFFGFPLRMASAHIANETLALFHSSLYTDSDLIYLDNRYLQVDVACSGFKGLWNGLICFALLSWLYRRRINLIWLLSLLVFCYCLVAFNGIRIATLAWLDLILQKPDLAAKLHQTLGVLGFTLSCLIAWLSMLLPQPRLTWPTDLRHHLPLIKLGNFRSPLRLFPLLSPVNKLAILLLFIALVNASAPDTSSNPRDILASPELSLPDNWAVTSEALNRQETVFFGNKPATVTKYRLRHPAFNGSFILVTSSLWKAQHNPKQCLQAQGYQITQEQTQFVTEAKRVKLLRLTRAGQNYSAIFWWQNADEQTEDYGKRIFDSIRHPHRPWTMVSILVQDTLSHNNIELINSLLSSQINRNFEKKHEYQS